MKKSKASFVLNAELTKLSITADKARILCDTLMKEYFDRDEFTQKIEFNRYYVIALILEDYIDLLVKESAKIENLANEKLPK